MTARDTDQVGVQNAPIHVPFADASIRLPRGWLPDETRPRTLCLVSFVRSLANDWAGFDGERQYASTEGQSTLVCRHDGHGTVSCRVTIGQPWPPEWSMTAELQFGAGAHLERIAYDLEHFFVSAA